MLLHHICSSPLQETTSKLLYFICCGALLPFHATYVYLGHEYSI